MIFIGMIIIIHNGGEDSPAPRPPSPIITELGRTVAMRGEIEMNCPHCDWFNRYETVGLARMGMAAHSRWCKRGKGTRRNIFG